MNTLAIKQVKAEIHKSGNNLHFPNSTLPIVIYRNALDIATGDSESVIEVFKSNNWGDTWTNSVYPIHHYHSTAHEVLGVSAGCAKIQFGGADGIIENLEKGDVVIIPAGVAHKKLGASHNFTVVGAYPAGQHMDLNYGEEHERPYADQIIARLPLPETDPVYGNDGELMNLWRN
jgi:uncharacterized protein YjlB